MEFVIVRANEGRVNQVAMGTRDAAYGRLHQIGPMDVTDLAVTDDRSVDRVGDFAKYETVPAEVGIMLIAFITRWTRTTLAVCSRPAARFTRPKVPPP